MPEVTKPVCPHCGGARFYTEAVPIHHPNFGKLMPCVCLLNEREERRRAADAAHLAKLNSELGTALRDRTLVDYDPDWPLDEITPGTKAADRKALQAGADSLRDALDAARAYAANPADDWLYLWGPPGTGKSHLAAAVAHAILGNPRLALEYPTAYYRSVPDMIDALRAGYREGTYDARLEAIKQVPILILDDLGTEDPTDKNLALLFQIINYRDKWPNVTIITSNLPIDDPDNPNADTIGGRDSRIASRIVGRCGQDQERIIPVIAGDYRAVRGRRRRAS